MPGMSHLHQFFGNRTTNAASTAQSLAGQADDLQRRRPTARPTGCPMLFQNGVAVPAMSALIYYRGGSHRDPVARSRAFPAGLRMIAGERRRRRAAARSTPWPGCARG